MSRLVCAAVSFSIGLVASAPHASGSYAVALDERELVTRADHIVLATVIDRRATRHHDLVVTDVTVLVEETLKGEAEVGRALRVRLLGGALGRVGLAVSGEATLTVGERAILFGEGRDVEAPLRPVGMAQGVLLVRQERGETLVSGDLRGVTLVSRGVDGAPRIVARRAFGSRTLREALDAIRALVRETAPRGRP